MFNKKHIEELEQTLNESNEKYNKDIAALENQVKDLKESLDKILDTLESKHFSKDWEEYQKWKEMKDKLPDIEEMYHLKKLKELISKKAKNENAIINARKGLYKVEADAFSTRELINSWEHELYDHTQMLESIVNQIEETLQFIRSKSNQKDLIEVFKLYGISTEWLQP